MLLDDVVAMLDEGGIAGDGDATRLEVTESFVSILTMVEACTAGSMMRVVIALAVTGVADNSMGIPRSGVGDRGRTGILTPLARGGE